MSSKINPARHQTALPDVVLAEAPSDEAVPMDVLFVGAGPAGLAGAIELARLVKKDNEAGGTLGDLEIGVLEKAGALGEHSLSGAVVNPRSLQELFPEESLESLPLRGPVKGEAVYLLKENSSLKLPTPPTMKNHGNSIASICEIVRWLGDKAEGLGINIFTGFPAQSLLVEDKKVIGVRTTPQGLNRDNEPGNGYEPATDLTARVTVLSEGTRGLLAQGYLDWANIRSPNPQIYALGVKEVWETRTPLDKVIHTLGWPLPKDAFGGTFCYPLEPNLVALGLVVGLDYKDQNLDVHQLLQRTKLHPLFKKYLQGGELVEWGAKTIPEGGYHSLPERMTGDGVILAGDAAGLVDVATLKGIHYAVQSGIYAARTIFEALKTDDVSAAGLSAYDRQVRESYIARDLHRNRNMRLAFKSGFFLGGVKASFMTLTGGRFPGGRIEISEDAAEDKHVTHPAAFTPDGTLTFSKVDAVFKSGNETRDTIPSHLKMPESTDPDAAQLYASMCPAGVYEVVDGEFKVNPPNCVDCKATDVLGPRWTPREGGSGPKYRRM